MIVLKIPELELKDFMNKLIKEETFDAFEIRGVEINSFTKIEISGIQDKDFLSDDEKELELKKYCTWKKLRPYVFNIIKGNKRPRSIKIVFSLENEKLSLIHENASALFLNMNFENNEISFTTGVSQKSFSMDKSLDVSWDDYVVEFFKESKITILHIT